LKKSARTAVSKRSANGRTWRSCAQRRPCSACSPSSRCSRTSSQNRASSRSEPPRGIGSIEPQSARVSIDGLKWLAGVERPDKYGEKYRAEHIIRRGPDVDADSVSEQWLNRLLTTPKPATQELPPNVVPLLPGPKKDGDAA